MKVKELTIVSLFTALMCVFSILQIPIGPVPITLQTTMVLITGAVLGKRLGAISMGIYVLLGAIGLPVFSGMQGGFGVLFGHKCGYIFGFILAAFVIGFIVDKAYKRAKEDYKKFIIIALAMLAGTVIIYVLGAIGLMIVLDYSVVEALASGILPFIVPDLIKLVFAVIITVYVKKALAKAGLFR